MYVNHFCFEKSWVNYLNKPSEGLWDTLWQLKIIAEDGQEFIPFQLPYETVLSEF